MSTAQINTFGVSEKYVAHVMSGYSRNPSYAQDILEAKAFSIALRKLLPEYRVQHGGYASVTISPRRENGRGPKFGTTLVDVHFNDSIRSNQRMAALYKNGWGAPQARTNKLDPKSVAAFVRKHLAV